jgi:hypothetical protein
LTLPVAIDNPEWTLASSGHLPWSGQKIVSHDGVHAGRSGPIGNNQFSTMDTTVEGPNVLTFWWKVSSEADSDCLEFYIDGELQSNRLSGEVDWRQETYTLGAGSHALSWRYIKDGSNSAGADTAWVDQIKWGQAKAGYDAWASDQFSPADLADSSISGPDADANRDGLVNLLHYAFNLSPYQNGNVVLVSGTGTTGLPAIRMTTEGGRKLVVEYVRRKASSSPELQYIPQVSTNLGTWVNMTATETVVSIDDVWERVTIQEDSAGVPVRFGRVRVNSSD